MNKQKVMEINKEFVKLVAENPELPIKVFINGECCEDDNCWYVGEVYNCKVTESMVTNGRSILYISSKNCQTKQKTSWMMRAEMMATIILIVMQISVRYIVHLVKPKSRVFLGKNAPVFIAKEWR